MTAEKLCQTTWHQFEEAMTEPTRAASEFRIQSTAALPTFKCESHKQEQPLCLREENFFKEWEFPLSLQSKLQQTSGLCTSSAVWASEK